MKVPTCLRVVLSVPGTPSLLKPRWTGALLEVVFLDPLNMHVYHDPVLLSNDHSFSAGPYNESSSSNVLLSVFKIGRRV